MPWRIFFAGTSLACAIWSCACFPTAAYTQTVLPESQRDAEESPTTDDTRQRPTPPIDGAWQRLSPDYDVWLDKKQRAVIVGGEICLREGVLEMFACPRHTKEHESIVSVNTPAFLVHTGLLAVGAEPGNTVQYSPAYRPATGTTIDVHVQWYNEQGKLETARAQEWIRESKTGQPMPHEWVFAGSGFWHDEETGQRHYCAEGGELICVSNFTTATLDLPVQSSQSNSSLLFEAFPQRVPPLGTRVHLILKPHHH